MISRIFNISIEREAEKMQQRKFKFLLVVLLVVSGLLFAGGEARAVTFGYDVTSYSVSPLNATDNYATGAVYSYTLSIQAGSSTLSYIDFEIPVEILIPAGSFASGGVTGKFSVTANGNPLSGIVYGQGVGDFGTKFGVGDPRYQVLKADIPNPTSTLTIVLTLNGQTQLAGNKRKFADQQQSEHGAVLVKAGNGSNTQTLTPTTPTIVDVPPPPTPPEPVITLSAFPNYVQAVYGDLNSTCSQLSWSTANAQPGTTVGISKSTGGSLGSGLSPSGTISDCPSETTIYTATVTGASISANTTVTVKGLPGAPSAPSGFHAVPDSITSGQQPLCVTLSWGGSIGTVTISAAGVPLASGLPPTGTFSVCPAVTTEYAAVAINSGVQSASANTTVTVNDPVIQTSCMQILKKPLGGGATCTNVCFEIGGERRLVSAEIFYNENCEPPGVSLAVFGPDVSNPVLRVPSLTCFPCDVDAGELRTPQCYGVLYQGTSLEPPFDINLGTHKVRCEFILKSYEPSGYTVDLGADPQFWNGARWINTPSCPTGYYDCKGTCKRTGTTCP